MVPRARHIRAPLLRGVHGFFYADAVSVVEPPDRADGCSHPARRQALADLLQREIGLLRD